VREASGVAAFEPPDETHQMAQGEAVLNVLTATGARVIAEDLGVIPKFVRKTLDRLEIPGYKVQRWERHWDATGKPFKNPLKYPAGSVATSSTHDTETIAEWWDEAPIEERQALVAVDRQGLSKPDPAMAFNESTRDAILSLLYRSGSDLLLLPIQDVFGWKDRINTPALINDDNWTWRLPWLVDEMAKEPAAVERAAFTRGLAERSGRASPAASRA